MLRIMCVAGFAACFGAQSVMAERFTHTYDMNVGGFRLATATIAGVAEGDGYAANAAMNARGLVGALTGGSFEASVRGRWNGAAEFAPDRFEQTATFRGETQALVIDYANGAPISTVYTPAREPDEDPIPTLSKQVGTVDFLTAMMTLTYPGTAEEICARSVVAFTFTKRTAIEGTGTVGGTADAPVCTVEYANVDPETLVAEETDTYTLSLRPYSGGRYEVAQISGPTDMGRAVFNRTN
ncbi:DUF3108 domain-containing protein [Pontivivens insulae]|uniref:DUF3108 domain-containing protein n=1 Tax=Pontivivens insulae TaxID=1639689 RepID=A0A2R8A648_9RHOB|nr:DUF3108 domain-containing protein [Pontivivens insulae]RED17827.1 uncharacterized protein DUF3108 [Pontivivens insulae]SPF27717.1 hypothetical protein POI8812_00010 [Pontivivens insulae]